jgi:nucleotide-binding universal stress UspA family protein
MTGRDPEPIRRILLALDAVGDSPRLLDTAIRLATRLDAELHALFVEDRNLLRLAGLPFAREVRLTSATTRRLQNQEMELTLRAQASRAQQALAVAAERKKVRWTFRVTRGDVATEVAGASTQTDLVAFNLGVGREARLMRVSDTVEMLVSGVVCPALVLLQDASLQPPFVAVYDGTPPSVRALELAARLARTDSSEVIVLVAASEERVRERRWAEAVARLHERGAVARPRMLTATDPVSLANAVRWAHAGTLVLPSGSPEFGVDTVRRLLERVECATLLVR